MRILKELLEAKFMAYTWELELFIKGKMAASVTKSENGS